ncbi:MAG: MFS transporter [Hyphomicrobiaceae bacterium]
MAETTATGTARPSAWAPFQYSAFTVLWIATVLSNVGTWMHDVGAGWLMTELSSSPLTVAGVQAATTLPIFLFALLAGAIADIVDRRWLLLIVNLLVAAVAAGLALLVYLNLVTPLLLILFTFLLGTGAAFMAPAWQALVPALVPRSDLSSAIALNSAGINISRAVGPALAGFLIVALGVWSPFALNALSFVGIIAALLWWRQPPKPQHRLPPEHVVPAIIAGWRYVANSAPLRATLIRAAAFFAFASAYWAMLPLIARELLSGGPTLYGLLLGAVGGGAVLGALLLPTIKRALGPDMTVAAGTLGTALVLAVFATVGNQMVAIAVSALAGMSWITVLSSFHVSAQTALPDWVRARGLSFFLTVFFGAMSAGSLIWGQVASSASIVTSLLIAAAGAILMIPLTWRAKLNQGEQLDLAPSMHWPTPVISQDTAGDRGPVMIQVIYKVPLENLDQFSALMTKLKTARRRGGGYGWTLMGSIEETDLHVETWFEASWNDHLRHHERVSGEDQKLQDSIRGLLVEGTQPIVKHYLAGGEKGLAQQKATPLELDNTRKMR